MTRYSAIAGCPPGSPLEKATHYRGLKILDEGRLKLTLMNEVRPSNPVIVPVWFDAFSGEGHLIVVDRVFQHLGSLKVSLRDPASGMRHLITWDDFLEAASLGIEKFGIIFGK